MMGYWLKLMSWKMMQPECQCSHCKELRKQQFRAYLRQERLLKIKEKHEPIRS